MSNISPYISKFLFLETKSYRKRPLRILIGSLLSAGVATLILLALVSYADPTAELIEFTLTPNTFIYEGNLSSTVNITTKVRNDNLFRAFNYTGGWIDLFYVAKDVKTFSADTAVYAQLTFNYTGDLTYQRALKTTTSKFYLGVYSYKLNFRDLKANQSHFYAYFYLSYRYKIFMFWTTNTEYYQWLDAHIYLDYDETSHQYKLQNQAPVKFHRSQDLRWAMTT